MFKRSLAGVVLFIGLGIASLSHALSLGELRLNSSLNQPFEAEVSLKDAGSLSNEQITIQLASVDDFEKAGVDYNYQLSNLIFTVSLSGNSEGTVRLTSREPIVEPYLNFLIEVRWPAGRMLREYTVLLDLPVVTAKTSTVSAAQGGTAVQAAREASKTREQVVILDETLESAGNTTGARADGDRTNLPKSERPTEYRVQHNDMLWNLAGEFKLEGATIHQTMLALLRKNPRAFIGDNINLLKSGYVLRLPSAEEALQVGQEGALKEVRRQNAVWRGEALPSDDEIDAQPQLDATGTAETAEASASKKPYARLSIATPGQSDSEGSAKSGASQAMRDQLAAAQEEADRAGRENAELSSRLSDMERQLATLQRLLELKDDQMATLQGQMGAESPALAVQAEQPTPEMNRGRLLDNYQVRYGLIALAVVILLLLLRRFSQNKTEAAFDSAHKDGEEPDFDSEPTFSYDDAEGDDPGRTNVIIEPREKDDETSDSAPVDEDFNDLADLLSDDEAADVEEELVVTQPMAPVVAETDDALAEADIYLAYGRYDQAAQMLSGAMAKEPDRTDLRIKLLGVYLETRDQANFLREFAALEALGDNDAISEVKESMSAVEGVSEWLRSGELTAETQPSVDETELDDLDFNLDEDDEPTAAAGNTEPAAPASTTPETGPDVEKKTDTGLDVSADDSIDLEIDDDFSLDDLDLSSTVIELNEDAGDDLGELSLDALELDEIDSSKEEPADTLIVAPSSALLETNDDESFADLDEDLALTDDPIDDDSAAATSNSDNLAELDDDDMSDDLGLFGDSDEVATKLDLARAYIDMGDAEGAKDMLQEVLEEGTDEQKQDANELLGLL
jgi:pilus assembly protein FimV